MSTLRTKYKSDLYGIAFLYNNVLGEHSVLNASDNNNKIFNVGGNFGGADRSAGYDNSTGYLGAEIGFRFANWGFGYNFGDWTLIPTRDFIGEVKIWGAGGGAHSHGGGSSNSFGGGGGYARAEIQFIKDIPYTIWVGQAGFKGQSRVNSNHSRNYRSNSPFGNGGPSQEAGSGGGLSGIFFNTFGNDGGPGGGRGQGHENNPWHGGVSTQFRSPSQNNALLIAGGGGGAGHSHSNHHGQAGGGGGTNGVGSHNGGGGSQTGGGGGGYNSADAGWQMHGGASGVSSVCGGGGGGWFGGGGGGHTSNHHDGGGGGSGHSLESNSVAGYRNFWIKSIYPNIVRNTYMETSPSSHGNRVNMPAANTDPDWGNAGCGGGTFGFTSNSSGIRFLTNSSNTTSGTNGRVVIKVIE